MTRANPINHKPFTASKNYLSTIFHLFKIQDEIIHPLKFKIKIHYYKNRTNCSKQTGGLLGISIMTTQLAGKFTFTLLKRHYIKVVKYVYMYSEQL